MPRQISFHWIPLAARRPAPSRPARRLAGMLLAASLAALLVVADQVIDTWTDGQLLAGWVALWTVTFAALALLAVPLRQLCARAAERMAQRVDDWRQRRREERMLEHALGDPRVLRDLRAVRTHDEGTL